MTDGPALRSEDSTHPFIWGIGCWECCATSSLMWPLPEGMVSGLPTKTSWLALAQKQAPQPSRFNCMVLIQMSRKRQELKSFADKIKICLSTWASCASEIIFTETFCSQTTPSLPTAPWDPHCCGILSVEIAIHELISHIVASPPKLARYGGGGGGVAV